MMLKRWMKETKTTLTDLSQASGVPIATIHRVLKGQQASAPVALKLWEATGYEVHLLSILYPDESFTFTLQRRVQNEDKKQVVESSALVVQDNPINQSERS